MKAPQHYPMFIRVDRETRKRIEQQARKGKTSLQKVAVAALKRGLDAGWVAPVRADS